MKLATFKRGSRLGCGAVIDEHLFDFLHPDVSRKAEAQYGSTDELIAAGPAAIEKMKRHVDNVRQLLDTKSSELIETGALLPLDAVELCAPIQRARIILSTGRAYRKHVIEMMGEGAPMPSEPSGFLKNANSVIASGDQIILPRRCPDMVDFEGEFAIVIGRDCHNVQAREALSYVAGYTLINDVSARDWNVSGPQQNWDKVRLAKQMATFCPLGPVVATVDEIADPDNINLTTRLNGSLMQSANTGDLIFPVAEIIAYFSSWYPFRPGDIITTGTPEGVGAGRKPPVYLRAGDTIEVAVAEIGVLSNTVKLAP